MIGRISELDDGAVLDAEVVVVGAGLAGIDLACFLGRRGIRTLLVESGRLEFDPAIQELARVEFAGKPLRTHETHAHLSTFLPPLFRGHCRIRQFGGTTNVWTGKWRVFDPWDFEVRPWIPHSGWPIRLADLLPFHEETARDYGFGDFDEAARSPLFRDAAGRLAPHGLEPHLFFWEETPTRSATRFFEELRDSSAVRVVLGATATDIELHDDLRTVRALRVAALDGRSCTLRGRQFVLATGGLEAPRLLLSSDRQLPGGIGNAHGLVGRFYMDHPKHKDLPMRPGRTAWRLIDGFRTAPRPRFGISVTLREEVQRSLALPNHAVFLRPAAGRRLGPLRPFEVKIGVEQLPNPESRVYLGAARDAVGMRQLVVDWRFTEADHDGFRRLQRVLADTFHASGLGRIGIGRSPLTLDEVLDASHHMGTTRMAATPQEGVVDPTCRVFGTENLYIASSSVFPTVHGYSPTYTILALARRIGTHLAERPADRAPAVRSADALQSAG